jgi:hypothetical protein
MVFLGFLELIGITALAYGLVYGVWWATVASLPKRDDDEL